MAGRECGAGDGSGRPPGLRPSARRVLLLALVVLAGAAFRIAPLTDNRFHPDEALFATLGRLIATGSDPLLQHTPLLVDKPPLLYYLLAAGISVSWGSEVSARLPGLFASVLSVALVARLAWQLWRSPQAALVAALLVALSPFAILFAPTAFADPLLVLWVLAALVAVTAGRWGWAGVLAGLALATKQSGLLFAPLVLALGAAANTQRSAARWLPRFALGLAPVLLLLAGWDALRGVGGGAWLAGLAVNDPGGLARASELWPRLGAWAGRLHYFTASTPLNVALGLGLAALAARELALRRCEAAPTLIVGAFGLAYLALHWLLAVPVLDRYLLPLVPLLALLAARAVDVLGERSPALYPASAALLTLLILPGALRAARSGYPVGGDHGAYDGIDRVAEVVGGLPEGSVVYTDSLGWSLAYYLYDARVYQATVSTPAALAADLRAFGAGGEQRVLILPGWQSRGDWLRAARAAGYEPQVMLQTTNRHGQRSLVVYSLLPRPAP